MSGPSYGLVLAQEQAVTLLALVTVADLAIRLKWEPPKEADANLLRGYVATVRAGVSLERPLTERRTWLSQQERGKSWAGKKALPPFDSTVGMCSRLSVRG